MKSTSPPVRGCKTGSPPSATAGTRIWSEKCKPWERQPTASGANGRPGGGQSTGSPWNHSSTAALAALIPQHEEVEAFDLFARPRCLAQELQAGCNAGIAGKAAHRNALCQTGPAITSHELRDYRFQRQPVQRVARLGRRAMLFRHRHIVALGRLQAAGTNRAAVSTCRPSWLRPSWPPWALTQPRALSWPRAP